jgi:hypothetical protein
MKNKEIHLVAIICVISLIAMSNYFYQATVLKHLDSVFLFESALSILHHGKPTSATVTSWPEALQTFTAPIEKLCQADLRRKASANYNLLSNHAYTALYPLALLTAVVGPEWAFALANAMAFLLLLVLPYVFLRRQKVDVFPSLAFVFLVVCYPGWSHSAIGDYYMDRLYMPFALASLYLMQAMLVRLENQLGIDKRWLWGYAATLLATALFTERAALMAILQIVFFLFFYPAARRVSAIRNVMLCVLALIGVYLWLYFKFVFTGIAEGGGLLENSLPILLDPLARLRQPLMIPFVMVNLMFLGFLVPLAGWRYLLLVALALLPNFMTSIGGAELNGWNTHYHSMYTPFLIFAASVGYWRLVRRLNVMTARFVLPVLLCCYLILLNGFFNPWSAKRDAYIFATARHSLPWQMNFYYLKGVRRFLSQRIHHWRLQPYLLLHPDVISLNKDLAQSLNTRIPQDSKVSTTEAMMAVLYKARNLSYYPIDLDNADYLVIGGRARDGQPFHSYGAISYLGESQTEALNQCLLQRIRAKGFTLVKDLPTKEVPNAGVLVFQRAKNAEASTSASGAPATNSAKLPAPN